MSTDMVYHTRTVYNLLDLLGDVGGCLDALKYVGMFLVWLLSGNSLSDYLVSMVSKYDDQDESANFEDLPRQTIERISKR